MEQLILWGPNSILKFTSSVNAVWTNTVSPPPPPPPPPSNTNYLLAVNGDRLVDVSGNPLTGV